MGATINYNFPIYDDDWPPDLTSTGAEAQAIIDIDTELKKQETQENADASRLNQLIQDERTERTDADTTLQGNIDKETAERKAADSELKASVENVENELTDVSAAVTGVFGLTYGDDNVNFIEKSGDAYSSPALVEIQHQITDASAAPAWDTVTDKPFETLGDGLSVTDGALSASGNVNIVAPVTTNNKPIAQEYSFAAGYGASAYVGNGVAIGQSAYVSRDGGIAIGARANCTNSAIALGIDAEATSTSVAFGAKAKSKGDSSVGVGYAATPTGQYGVSIGANSVVNKANGIAIGNTANSYGDGAIAIGVNTQGNSTSSVAIGNTAICDQSYCVAVGGNAQSTGAYAVGVGWNSNASISSCALGAEASATNDACVALGRKANAANAYSVALGAQAQTSRDYEISIGSGTARDASEVTRLIAHVSDPEDPTDAANMQYVDNSLATVFLNVTWGELES